jgi:hypothetical protein
MRATPTVLALLCLASSACEPLPPVPDYRRGPLKVEAVGPGMDSIPSEYGELVGVTSLPGQPYEQTLWFVQPDRTIIAVRVNVSLGIIGQVMTIPRR